MKCDHQCSGNCRRVGCNCSCGEWHDDRQRLLVEVRFKEHHTPATEGHLTEILRAYLKPKGINLEDDLTIGV